MNKTFAELIGTFTLVFAGTGAIVANQLSDGKVTHVGVGLTFGLVVMAMIYTLGDRSGAHINPAVTLALWLSNRHESKLIIPYIIAQLSGALLASFIIKAVFFQHSSDLGTTLPGEGILWWQAMIFEFFLTYILMFVILNVSHQSNSTGPFAGIAIGGVVAFEAIFAGPICGASMNPARSIGPALASGNLTHLWIYIVAPVAGACSAVPTFRLLMVEDPKNSTQLK